jgi:hypothetical protein
MNNIEVILWVVTAIIVLTMIGRTLHIAVAGIRFWLRPNMWLLLRIPVFLVAVWCILAGIELVYDINLAAWFSQTPISQTESHIEFRWWVLLFTPIVLSIASLGFTAPYLAYFLLIPHLQQSERFDRWTRLLLSALVALAVPVLVYSVMYVL